MSDIWEFPEIHGQDLPTSFMGHTSEGTAFGREVIRRARLSDCPQCDVPLRFYTRPGDFTGKSASSGPTNGAEFMAETREARVCAACGWWAAQRTGHIWGGAFSGAWIHQGSAILKQLDVSDLGCPIGEVRQYLVARYEERHTLHPRLMEEVVAEVFRGLGYSAVVTGYSNDGGVDVILHRGGECVGVQVKRSKNTIGVAQIREVLGALMLGGLTRGVFVTTSDYSRGAAGAAQDAAAVGIPIELWDALRFLDALRITRRPMYRCIEDFEERGVFQRLPLIEVST